jgi:transcriptional regulator with XRE-family HTH domain
MPGVSPGRRKFLPMAKSKSLTTDRLVSGLADGSISRTPWRTVVAAFGLSYSKLAEALCIDVATISNGVLDKTPRIPSHLQVRILKLAENLSVPIDPSDLIPGGEILQMKSLKNKSVLRAVNYAIMKSNETLIREINKIVRLSA